MIRRLGDNVNLQCNGPHYPLVPYFYIPAVDFVVGFPGDAAMVDKFGRAPLVSPPAPALGNGAATARRLLQAPCNVRSDRTLRRSSADARVPSPSFVSLLCSSAMADAAAGAVRLFATA